MEEFSYTSPGELYYPRGKTAHCSPYHRHFNSAAEALRYAIEGVPAPFLQGCFMEVEGERYGAKQMRQLYESAKYPLPRLEA
jgi:hypothetical protein